jgi:hypothetical protein
VTGEVSNRARPNSSNKVKFSIKNQDSVPASKKTAAKSFFFCILMSENSLVVETPYV